MAGSRRSGRGSDHNNSDQQQQKERRRIPGKQSTTATEGKVLSMKSPVLWTSITLVLLTICLVFYLFVGTTIGDTNFRKGRDKKFRLTEQTTYDEYVVLSEANGWDPTDPIEKLEDTITKFMDVYDIGSPEDPEMFGRYVNMLELEVGFLLQLLGRTTDRTIDLTKALETAIDVIQKVGYRLMKASLNQIPNQMPQLDSSQQQPQQPQQQQQQRQQQREVTTYVSVTYDVNHWMYQPVREIFSLMSRRLSHIVIDVNRPLSAVNPLSIFEKAVQSRLYGLFSTLIALGVKNLDPAMHIAICNGDDFAVTLLLKLDKFHRIGHETNPEREVLQVTDTIEGNNEKWLKQLILKGWGGSYSKFDFIQLSDQLKYYHIKKRLLKAFDMNHDNQQQQEQQEQQKQLLNNNDPTNEMNIFNEYTPSYYIKRYQQYINNQIIGKNNGGYDNFQVIVYNDEKIMMKDPKDDAGPNDNKGPNHWKDSIASYFSRTPQCDIDHISYNNLNIDLFQQYALLNQPLIITNITFKQSQLWNMENLIEKYGLIQEAIGTIPYSTLFGKSENLTSLRDFIYERGIGMRSFTNKLKALTNARGACPAVDDDENIAAPCTLPVTAVLDQLGIPEYIFSGPYQNLNKAMRREILEMVISIEAKNDEIINEVTNDAIQFQSDRPGSTNLMLEMMFAISASNLFTTSLSGKPMFGRTWSSQFFLGPPLSGAPFHNHGPAFNFLLYGHKIWTLLPPARDIYSRIHPLEWIKADGIEGVEHNPYRDEQNNIPCELHQNAGEVVFIPRHWTHQVLNIAESIGFAVEIDDYIY